MMKPQVQEPGRVREHAGRRIYGFIFWMGLLVLPDKITER